MTDEELREQIDAFILKFEGIDAEKDTLDCIMWSIEQRDKARDVAVRIDQMTEDLGISKASIAVNREELIAELRRESDLGRHNDKEIES